MEIIIEKNKEYRIEQNGEIIKKSKQYYVENKEKIAKHDKQYYANNKNEIIKSHNNYNKNRRINNPIYRLIVNNSTGIHENLENQIIKQLIQLIF